MSTIRDIIELTSQLINNVKFRKFTAEISKIQSLISTLQSEQIETTNKISDISNENINLKSKNHKLNLENSNLKQELSNLKSDLKKQLSDEKLQDKYTFNSTYGFYESKESGHPFCASCLPKNIESPLTVKPSGWRCELNDCKKFISNPSFKMQKRETPRYFKRR